MPRSSKRRWSTTRTRTWKCGSVPSPPNELLTWAEAATVATADHPHPWTGWNFSEQFPADAVCLSSLGDQGCHWESPSPISPTSRTGKKRARRRANPACPARPIIPRSIRARSPSISKRLQRAQTTSSSSKSTPGHAGSGTTTPSRPRATFEQRIKEASWEQESPKLVLRKRSAELAFSPDENDRGEKGRREQARSGSGHRRRRSQRAQSRRDHRQAARDRLIETVFVRDHGLDRARYLHLKKISKKQYLSGKPVQRGTQQSAALDACAAHERGRRPQGFTQHRLGLRASIPGCILLFERLRKIKRGGGSTSRRMNRRQSNQLRGKINQYAKDKNYAQGLVTIEVNPHGTSQYCSRCAAKGERFSYRNGVWVKEKWGKVFRCPVCHYEANADHNASVNMHHSFYDEWHWQPKKKPPPDAAPSG